MDCNRCAVWWRRGHGVRSAIDLLDELNAVDESARIEAKRASEMGKFVRETVIAFANEPGMDGGYLLLGVDWAINDKGDTVYRAVGLPDPDKAQRDLATLAASRVLRRLRDRGLLIKEGSGSATYYVLSRSQATLQAEPPQLLLDMGSAAPYGETPPACNLELATLLGKDRHYLLDKHLIPMVAATQLRFLYPESAKHPNQAYVTSGNPSNDS